MSADLRVPGYLGQVLDADGATVGTCFQVAPGGIGNGQRKHHDSMSGDGYDACMRTTVTLDDDVVAALRTAMRERGVSFKEALNSAVRSGLSAANPSARPYRVTPFTAEIRPGVDLTKVNRLLADWEDEEILRKLELGK
ncbi:MAG: CopG family transcriptional regulator [Pseudonocardiaceae bacterium]